MSDPAPQADGNPAAFPLTTKDLTNLARPDSPFKPHTWSDLAHIIATNDLKFLRRQPSDLKRYDQWTRETKETYGTTTNYICKERLAWTPLPIISNGEDAGPVFEVQNPIPFADGRDYKILRNDWPYGLEKGVEHLVVWLKNRLPVDSASEIGDLEAGAREAVEGFVRRTFVRRLERAGVGGAGEKVMWFRNWTGLQSVRGIDHVHILVRDVPAEVLEGWTGETP